MVLRVEVHQIIAVLSSTNEKSRRRFVVDISFQNEVFQMLQTVECLGNQAHAKRPVSPEPLQELEVQNELEVHLVDLVRTHRAMRVLELMQP